MAQVLGVVDIVWRGRNIPVEKGAKAKIGGMQNVVVTYGRKAGRAEEFVASEIEAVTALEKGQRYGNLWDTGEGELQAVCDTGQTFVWNDAFLTERPDITGGEGGKITLKWGGGEPEEILA
ncbi:hypothetical protein CO666_03605 [Rhizobium chutanense]|uniref:Phage tail protein n=1 Tax=Rhizobium chutanense TaxID=2035448 RepID=A0A2A6JHH9_9HYPH|nr:phage tail tube protein [Rhizobium chutanense]PDT05701.1 hypothetical protein CO666_03605 [Rhizobium chutanense]